MNSQSACLDDVLFIKTIARRTIGAKDCYFSPHFIGYNMKPYYFYHDPTILNTFNFEQLYFLPLSTSNTFKFENFCLNNFNFEYFSFWTLFNLNTFNFEHFCLNTFNLEHFLFWTLSILNTFPFGHF